MWRVCFWLYMYHDHYPLNLCSVPASSIIVLHHLGDLIPLLLQLLLDSLEFFLLTLHTANNSTGIFGNPLTFLVLQVFGIGNTHTENRVLCM